MIKAKIAKIGAAFLTLILMASALSLPISADTTNSNYNDSDLNDPHIKNLPTDTLETPIAGDTIYEQTEESLLYLTEAPPYRDIGYNFDAGNDIRRSLTVYIGEPVDETSPGNGRTGYLDAENRDTMDWYRFVACEGQSFQSSVTGGFLCEFVDKNGESLGQSFTAEKTDDYFFSVSTETGVGEYTFNIAVNGQNDAGTGSDAGNNINSATPIAPGEYTGYMDYSDQEDWYSFQANAGDGIVVHLENLEKSDYDIHLYNPSGVKVYDAQYYMEDTLEYPADESGTWTIQLDMFPGWDASKWPDNYDLYGSGPYTLELSIGGTVAEPPGPIPQKNIIPVAQTFIINDDPDSNMDEYSYVAAVPAANYIKDGQRYVSPIVYQGVDTITHWFGTVDDTTQYLLDDWNTYLDRHGITAEEYIVPSDPIKAAAEIASNNWESSDTAVVVCDGSDFEDDIVSIVDETVTLTSTPEIKTYRPGDLTTLGTASAKFMYIGADTGALQMWAKGDDFSGDASIITPRYEVVQLDNWPSPYDVNGPDKDVWFPIIKPGIWVPQMDTENGLEELEIITYPGNRYSIPVDDADQSIEVTIETDEPSLLMAFVIDPEGNIRKPNLPEWNGGEVQPLHYWNGGHWQHNFEDYRRPIFSKETERSVAVHNVEPGDWTVVVVPYLDHETGYGEFTGSYHITINARKYGNDRVNAEMSAANGAVLASLNHAPLLYVTKDAVPTETANAIASLGVSNIIFVNIGEVSSASVPGTVTEYSTMQEVVDAIKASSLSENFITITSVGTGDGYFAPSAMIAAYHVGPVLNVADAKEAYNVLDATTAWREWTSGDYYHGSRTMNHLPQMDHPSELPSPANWLQVAIYYLTHGQELPHFGGDLELVSMSAIYAGFHDMIDSYGLDLPGQEVYMFVAPRDYDIRDLAVRAMMGNNSYAGHIPSEPVAMSSAVIVRNVLYPAIIYANPGRDVSTSQMMNFPDPFSSWTTNDGKSYNAIYSSREMKASMSSHGRFYEGHCLWDNLLARYNEGACVSYYSGHGTGGSGISAQWRNINEQFPYVEPRVEWLKDHEFPDAWRGYMYDDTPTKNVRSGGFTWYNAKEPNLYNLVHFKWVDQLFDNLHSIVDIWMSCTTASDDAPDIYLEHGAAVYFGNGNTGLCPQEDLLDDWWIHDMMVYGSSIGEAFSKYLWLHQRDYTTMDPTTIYGTSSLQVSNEQMIYGDPTITVYSPEWTEPIPISP